MTNKTCNAYCAIFNYIEANIFKMQPAEFITDFESSMRKAINLCYPNIILRGCWYHYCCALRRKFLKLGLHSLLKNDENARSLKQQLMSLPLLPIGNFDNGYQHIKRSANDHGLSNWFKDVFIYFEGFWITEVIFQYIFTHEVYLIGLIELLLISFFDILKIDFLFLTTQTISNIGYLQFLPMQYQPLLYCFQKLYVF